MDEICKPLHAHLVRMAYEGCTHEQEHHMEHLFALLEPEEEDAVAHYYGLFGHQRRALADIASSRNEQPEETLAAVEHSLRRLAISPEWQMMLGELENRSENKVRI